MKKIISLILLLGIATYSYSKEGKVKMSSICEYVGNVENKLASGAGTLTINNPLIKGAADVITGTFETSENGSSISNACINFSSGWKYFGNAQITVDKGDSHNSSVRISLADGEMRTPSEEYSFKIGNDPVVFSRNYNKSAKLYSMEGLVLHGRRAFYHKKPFSEYTKCDSVICNFNLPVRESDGVWEYKFEPVITNHLEYTNGCCCDVDGSDWECTTPKGDTVSFHKGQYKAIRNSADAYLTYVENDESFYQSRTAGKFTGLLKLTVSLPLFMTCDFSDSDIKYISGLQEYPDSSKVRYRNGEIVGLNKSFLDGTISSEDEHRAKFNLNEGVTGFNGVVSLKEPFGSVISKTKLSEIQFSPIEGSMKYENGDILYYKNGEICGFYKRFKDALMEIRDNKGIVNYYDGGHYNGSMKVWTEVGENNITALTSINDISLEYIDGEEIHPNGTSDIWKNSLTEYLKNKEAGNYAKFQSAMDDLNRDKVAALAKKWDQIRPSLEAEWGSRTVNAFYEGRFILGTPRGFIERLKELHLPLMGIVGPMQVDGVYNDYMVFLADRVNGQRKTSYILRFGGLFDELLSINK